MWVVHHFYIPKLECRTGGKFKHWKLCLCGGCHCGGNLSVQKPWLELFQARISEKIRNSIIIILNNIICLYRFVWKDGSAGSAASSYTVQPKKGRSGEQINSSDERGYQSGKWVSLIIYLFWSGLYENEWFERYMCGKKRGAWKASPNSFLILLLLPMASPILFQNICGPTWVVWMRSSGVWQAKPRNGHSAGAFLMRASGSRLASLSCT